VSSSSPFARRSTSSQNIPTGDVLGDYTTYLDAQKVIDRLAKADFAVKGMAIVGHDLTTVERITGRQTYARAALTGTASGAWLGLFVGLLLVLFSPEPEFSFLFAAGFIGAGFGMIFGIVSYTISRRRRDFTSTNQVLAGSYQVIIDPLQTARARQALAGGSGWPPPVDTSSADAEAVAVAVDPDAVAVNPDANAVDPDPAGPGSVSGKAPTDAEVTDPAATGRAAPHSPVGTVEEKTDAPR
jgi:hypothetical protein